MIDGISSEQHVYNKIQQALYEQRLAPGASLTERTACEAFGVGRTAVRAAFRRLAEDGYLELIPNRGAFVVTGSRELLQDYYEMRTELELIALKKCIADLKETDFAELERIARIEAEAYSARDFKVYLDCIGEFYTYIISKARSQVLLEQFRYLYSRQRVLIVLYDYFYDNEHLDTLSAHSRVIALLREHDLEGVEKELKEHAARLMHQMRFNSFATANAKVAFTSML